MSHLSSQARAELAAALGCSAAYLYQCLSGRREMGAQQAVDLEQRSGRRLRRWQLCSKTWHRIWPELIGTEGAPPAAPASLPAEEREVCDAAA